MIRRFAALIAASVVIVAAASWTPAQAADRPHPHNHGHHYGQPRPSPSPSRGDGTHPIIMLCDGTPTQPIGCPVAGQRG